uniref:Uncharacterized protein n=1 Tax=Aotus nancymaae TaxID=37293 RepID=A0A2K5C5E7_AOTNA
MKFQLMYVNMFNKIYFSCQSVAICVLCLARFPLWVLWCKMGARPWEGEAGVCCLLWAFGLTCHCTILCLNRWPKGYFASPTSFHFVSLSK